MNDTQKKNPRAGFSQHFSREGAIPAQAISRSRAPERKENAIREDSRGFAVGYLMYPHPTTSFLNCILHS